MADEYNRSFYCPITGAVMIDPVIDREGNSYERSAITVWINEHQRSPITRNHMTLNDLIPNRVLQETIQEEIQKSSRNNTTNNGNNGTTSLTQAHHNYDNNNNHNSQQSNNTPYIIDFETANFNINFATKHIVQPSIFPSNINQPLSNHTPISTLANPNLTNMATPIPQYKSYQVLASTLYSDENAQRVPSDIVLILDVSGSMNDISIAPGNTQESIHLSLTLLDIVKHATRTVIETLNEYDRLALITFSTNAHLIFDFITMNPQGKLTAKNHIRNLTAQGMTNLWSGLHKGLELIRNRPLSPGSNHNNHQQNFNLNHNHNGSNNHHHSNRINSTTSITPTSSSNVNTNQSQANTNTAIFLLTDGEPNIDPPRGVLPMLKKYKHSSSSNSSNNNNNNHITTTSSSSSTTSHSFSTMATTPSAVAATGAGAAAVYPCAIHTFGFGYSLDSELLYNIACEAEGMYSFIPDSGFVGTAFVHALANTVTKVVGNAQLVITPAMNAGITSVTAASAVNDFGGMIASPSLLPLTSLPPVILPLGPVYMGQSSDRVVTITVKGSSNECDVSLQQSQQLELPLNPLDECMHIATATTGTSATSTTSATSATSPLFTAAIQIPSTASHITTTLCASAVIALTEEGVTAVGFNNNNSSNSNNNSNSSNNNNNNNDNHNRSNHSDNHRNTYCDNNNPSSIVNSIHSNSSNSNCSNSNSSMIVADDISNTIMTSGGSNSNNSYNCSNTNNNSVNHSNSSSNSNNSNNHHNEEEEGEDVDEVDALFGTSAALLQQQSSSLLSHHHHHHNVTTTTTAISSPSQRERQHCEIDYQLFRLRAVHVMKSIFMLLKQSSSSSSSSSFNIGFQSSTSSTQSFYSSSSSSLQPSIFDQQSQKMLMINNHNHHDSLIQPVAVTAAGIGVGQPTLSSSSSSLSSSVVQAQSMIAHFIRDIQACIHHHHHHYGHDDDGDDDGSSVSAVMKMRALCEDFTGQIAESISRAEYYNKWGKHYLLSLARAHEMQLCTNFKDPGLQYYGGSVFTVVRDIADDLFCNLPPPTFRPLTTPTSNSMNQQYHQQHQQQQLSSDHMIQDDHDEYDYDMFIRNNSNSSSGYHYAMNDAAIIPAAIPASSSSSSIPTHHHPTATRINNTATTATTTATRARNTANIMSLYNDRNAGCIHGDCVVMVVVMVVDEEEEEEVMVEKTNTMKKKVKGRVNDRQQRERDRDRDRVLKTDDEVKILLDWMNTTNDDDDDDNNNDDDDDNDDANNSDYNDDDDVIMMTNGCCKNKRRYTIINKSVKDVRKCDIVVTGLLHHHHHHCSNNNLNNNNNNNGNSNSNNNSTSNSNINNNSKKEKMNSSDAGNHSDDIHHHHHHHHGNGHHKSDDDEGSYSCCYSCLVNTYPRYEFGVIQCVVACSVNNNNNPLDINDDDDRDDDDDDNYDECMQRKDTCAKTMMVHFETGLMITPWHPVRLISPSSSSSSSLFPQKNDEDQNVEKGRKNGHGLNKWMFPAEMTTTVCFVTNDDDHNISGHNNKKKDDDDDDDNGNDDDYNGKDDDNCHIKSVLKLTDCDNMFNFVITKLLPTTRLQPPHNAINMSRANNDDDNKYDCNNNNNNNKKDSPPTHHITTTTTTKMMTSSTTTTMMTSSTTTTMMTSSSILVNDIECITFGSGIQHDTVVSHPFFSTHRVLIALQKCAGWKHGWIQLCPQDFVRDKYTNDVIDIISNINSSSSS